MLPYTLAPKLIAIALGASLTALGGFMLYNHIWYKGYDQAQAEFAEKERIAVQEYANGILEYGNEVSRLRSERDANKNTIDNLSGKLRGMRNVHIPTCPKTHPAESEPDSDGRGRILSDGVDAAFRDLQSGVDEIVRRCDEMNADAIEQNGKLIALLKACQ